jgi:hypothetical protein
MAWKISAKVIIGKNYKRREDQKGKERKKEMLRKI